MPGGLAQGNRPFVPLEVTPAVPTQAKVQVKFATLTPRERALEIIDYKPLKLLAGDHEGHNAYRQRA